ncbi:MAG: ribosome-associated GTPase EngA, partial [Oligoflexia bacterium]|nr:ribosome-associated GTPase EngA [Oligoflexia bacterium]
MKKTKEQQETMSKNYHSFKKIKFGTDIEFVAGIAKPDGLQIITAGQKDINDIKGIAIIGKSNVGKSTLIN